MKDIACQATLAFVVETKLLVYNINLHLSASVSESETDPSVSFKFCPH